MSIRTELDKTALYLRNARNAVIGRGGEISATAGFKDLASAITNIPNDQAFAWQTVESNSKRVIVPSGVLPMAQVKKLGGMSKKCNQLLKLRTLNETQDGITVTTNEDGSYTFNGVTEVGAYFSLWLSGRDIPYTSIGAGRTYRISVEIIGEITWNTNQGFVWIGESYPEDSYPNFETTYTYSGLHNNVYTPEEGRYLEWIDVLFPEGAEVNNVTVKIMVNEGNEYLPYEPYFEGIRDSKTKSIVSEGANLLDISKAVNANFVDNGDGTYTLTHNGGTQRFSANMPLNIPANTPIAFKGILISGDARAALDFKFADGTESDALLIDNYSRTRTYVKDIISARFYISSADTGKSIICSNIQLVYGTTAKEYKPFVGIQANVYIPEAVRNLEGYGLGINADYYNYVEWREGRCYLIKAVDKIVFNGTEAWNHYNEGEKLNQFHIYIDGLNNVSATNIPMTLNNKYLDTTITGRYQVFESLCSYNSGRGGFLINTLVATNVEEYKAYLAELYAQGDPLTVIYALAEPIETDITDLMTVDNHIAVEGGGTVEFVNEYGYDIPNEINYLFNTAGG